MKIKRENKKSNMADKTEKAVDLGILEEDDEFEEFPAEDWKETNESELKNVRFFRSILFFFRRFLHKMIFCNEDILHSKVYHILVFII